MTRRLLTLICSGAAIMAIAVMLFEALRKEPVGLPVEPERVRQWRARTGELAPVRVLKKKAPFTRADWNSERSAQITLDGGKILVGGKTLDRALICDYLNELVRSGSIDAVLVITSGTAPMADVMSVIEECRKSSVSAVWVEDTDV